MVQGYISLFKAQDSLSHGFFFFPPLKHAVYKFEFFGVKNQNLKYFFGHLRIAVPMRFLQLLVLWAGQPAQTPSSEQQLLSHWDSRIRGLWELQLHQGMKRASETAQWDPQIKTPNFREKIWKLKTL